MEAGRAGPREVGCALYLMNGQVGLVLPLSVAVPQALGLVTDTWMRQEQGGSLSV